MGQADELFGGRRDAEVVEGVETSQKTPSGHRHGTAVLGQYTIVGANHQWTTASHVDQVPDGSRRAFLTGRGDRIEHRIR